MHAGRGASDGQLQRGARAIALRLPPTLRTLVVVSNGIGAEGATALAAHTTARLLAAGASASVAVAAGERAAMALIQGEPLAKVTRMCM